ncbi:MAG: hypothetical protein QOK22_2994 [Gaiellaceae bacterium]|nr:hypothetical protein [Gaiellaceae bacterium]
MRSRSLRLAFASLLALALAAGAAHAQARLVRNAASTWSSTYTWAAGDGTAGWATETTAPGLYGLRPSLGGEPGLWLWPAGGRYDTSSEATWRLTAPGSTTIATATFDVAYRNKLLAHHCIEVGLRDASGVVASALRCKPMDAPGDPAQMRIRLADPSVPATATQAFFRIRVDCGGAATCSKNIPSLDPLATGGYARLTRAAFTLTDADAPTVVATGPFVALGGTYIDGRSSYGLTVSAADGGSGVASASVQHDGGADIAAAAAPCDPTHSTPSLGAAICPPTFVFSRTIDATQLAEGTSTFHAVAADYAGNRGTGNSWSIAIDRTPPALANGFALGTYDEALDRQPVTWSAGADPALVDGTAGSGVGQTEVRYGYDGGPLGDWETVGSPAFVAANAFSTHTLQVEVRETDAVGNASAASASFTVPTPAYAVGKPWLLPQCHSDATSPPDFCTPTGPPADDAAAAPDTCDGSVPGLCEATGEDVQAAGLDPSALDSFRSEFLSSIDATPVSRLLSARRSAVGNVIVPNVIGQSAQDAFDTLLSADMLSIDYLRAGPSSVVVDQEFCGGYDTGIPFGTAAGLNVGLFFNSDTGPDPYSCAGSGGGGGGGPTPVAVPDVSGLTVAEAQRTLQAAGFSATTLTWDKATAGTPVFGTEPGPGTMAVPTENIKLNFVHGPHAGVELYGFLVFQLVRTGVKPGGANPCASAPVVDSGHCGFLYHLSTPVRTRDHVVVGPTFYTVFNARSGGGTGVYGNDPAHVWAKGQGPMPDAWASSAHPAGQRVQHWGWQDGRRVGFTATSNVSYYPGFWILDPQQVYSGANQTGVERDGLLIHGGWQGHQLDQVGTLGCIRIMYSDMPRLNGLWANWTDNKGQSPGPPLYKQYEP